MKNAVFYLVIIIFSSMIFSNINIVQTKSNEKSTSLNNRTPIFVNNDNEFTSIYHFPGYGNSTHPFLIENFNITYGSSILIGIFNTIKYFKIANNYLNNMNYNLDGIYLYNVKNGFIENNTIAKSRHGIFLDNCQYNSVNSNSITSTGESGIRLKNSLHINIYQNAINSIKYNGIWLDNSKFNTINENAISDVKNTTGYSGSGIWLKSSSNENKVVNNTISSSFHGILVSSSNLNNVTNNLLKNDNYGIYAIPKGYIDDPFLISEYNRFMNNTLYSNSFYGLMLTEGVINSTVSFNMFLGNYIGSTSQAFDNGSSNSFVFNFWDEWTGPDKHGNESLLDIPDGFVDNVYSINGPANNNDSYPLTDYVSMTTFDFLSRPKIYHPIIGETISGTYSVEWASAKDTQNKAVSYTLYYSNNSGINWNIIDENITIPIYQWDTFLLSNGSQYMLKVQANNSNGLITTNLLNGTISIINGEHYLLSPTLNYPVVGIIIGETIKIQWAGAIDSYSSHLINYSISYSNNSGINWYIISNGINTNEYDWNTLLVPDGNYLLKINAFCTGGLNSSTIMKGYFTIRNTLHTLSQVVLQTPNGGESIKGNTTIKWSESIDSWGHKVSYSLYYTNNSGSSWNLIVTDLLTTEYIWSTFTLTGGSNYLLKVVAVCPDFITSEDTSDAVFTIVEIKHALSELKVISPNGGENVSGIITITWSNVNDSWNHDIYYSIFYSSDNGSNWNLLIENITISSFIWNTTAVANGPNNLIKVIVFCSSGLLSQDISDQTFTIDNNNIQSSTSSISTTETNSTSALNSDNLVVITMGAIVIGGIGSGAGFVFFKRYKLRKK